MLRQVLKKFRKISFYMREKGFIKTIKLVYQKVKGTKLKNYTEIVPFIKNKTGLEIGGPSQIFFNKGAIPIYQQCKSIDGCNYSSETIWSGGKRMADTNSCYTKNYITEATDLKQIESENYDFLISSHCIEHIANPIKALMEWKRVLKVGGIMILVVPHKDGTFDHKRPVTKIKHIVDDYINNTLETDTTHIEETLRLHDIDLDSGINNYDEFANRIKDNITNRSIHHHVFTTDLMVKLVDYIGMQIMHVATILPCNIVVVAKKIRETDEINNLEYLTVEAVHHKSSPFKSDLIN